MSAPDTQAPMREVQVGGEVLSNRLPLVLMAGPCVIESRAHCLPIAKELKRLAASLGLGFIFKSSFDKANRSHASSARGVGLDAGLEILAEIKSAYSVPVMTDVHLPEHCAAAAEVVDLLQIPAFLCRQTDLLQAAARSGRPVMIKKGQFLSPEEIFGVISKLAGHTGGIILCERGTFFGYHRLVNDFRALPIMARSGWPVVFDATHSVQEPGSLGRSSGGARHFVPVLARAAVAVGVAGLFLEVHDHPERAPSDGPNMLPLSGLPDLLPILLRLDRCAKSCPPFEENSL